MEDEGRRSQSVEVDRGGERHLRAPASWAFLIFLVMKMRSGRFLCNWLQASTELAPLQLCTPTSGRENGPSVVAGLGTPCAGVWVSCNRRREMSDCLQVTAALVARWVLVRGGSFHRQV
ncbi:unnamed protein product [Pleuronectes platessa]|uniref:Uncharacterized protein n=1 Tax=Pleuronectes platessa TaxID=8262 RepID=A0A9N7VYW9_PLEPL|nr:unnamed protein product [Pleuronectes platessa]